MDTTESPKINEVELESLIRQAMASGAMYFAENQHQFRGQSRSLGECFGNWPSEFLALRPDLIEELIEQ